MIFQACSVYDDIPYDAENQVYSLTMSYLLES